LTACLITERVCPLKDPTENTNGLRGSSGSPSNIFRLRRATPRPLPPPKSFKAVASSSKSSTDASERSMCAIFILSVYGRLGLNISTKTSKL
jgi:hypothetical protein